MKMIGISIKVAWGHVCRTCHENISPCDDVTYRGVCENCYAIRMSNWERSEKDRQKEIGSRCNVPRGFSLKRCSRVPGVGEGRDFFGNHT